MLKINNIKFKKYRIPLLLIAISLGGIFLYQYLTFIPEYSHAESISTKPEAPAPTLPEIEGEITKKFGTETQGYKTYMQEIDLKYCQSLPEKTTGQLADGRDGKIYWVTVLGAGSDKTCWMTQDLDLDLGPNGPTLTTKNDGDNLYKGSATTWDGGKSVTSSNSGWTQINYTTVNWWERDNGTHKAEHTFLGNLYSYQAATAGTGRTYTNNGGENPGSICPAGWKLPIGGDDDGNMNKGIGSFNSLGISSGAVIKDPYYFQCGGYIEESLGGVGSNGNYWSATSANSNYAYSFELSASGGFSNWFDDRYRGFSVRCVVRDPNYTAPTIPTPSDTDINDPNISVTIPNIITLSLSSEVVDIDTSTSNPAEGNFTATVTSNSKYNLALSATAPEGQTPHTDLKNEDPNKTTSIPALSFTNPIVTEADESWWGIKCTNPTDSTNCTKTAYAGLTLTPETYFTSTSGTPSTGIETPFTIGIKISPSLPSGTYSTSIQVTASSTGSN